MKNLFLLLISVFLFASCASSKMMKVGPKENEKWVGLHLLHNANDYALDTVSSQIPKLAEMGINVLFYELNYSFDYQSHPELRLSEKNITKESARKFSKLCRENDIRLVVQFQCFGHQSWAQRTYPLLIKYPHLDLTPGAYPNNDSIYCREWDPTNPQVYEIVFSLMDELIDAFELDGFHIGMDEVFLISDSNAVNTRDKNPAEVFANSVNMFYEHLVNRHGLEMFMWGDRLIDAEKIGFSSWEASSNGTAPAIDMIPKDIVICDWHYGDRVDFPSIPMFINKGFRVLPAGWKDVNATKKLIEYSYLHNDPLMLGHLFTVWSSGVNAAMKMESIQEGLKLLKQMNQPVTVK